ncbi:MAG: hypothetical protein M3R69_10895 [Acidobacteriota bacterium]|nr:hypothetical protein [Acidobacteriota bacterium]
MTTTDNYRPVYLAALQELTELLAELENIEQRRDEIDSRVADVKKGVLALGSLCGEQPWVKYPDLFPDMSLFASAGLTPSIRTILSRPPADWVTPVGVRDALKDVGYQGKSTNVLPSVHTVLKRLVDAGEVESDSREGRTWYRWKGGAVVPEVPTLRRLQRLTNQSEQPPTREEAASTRYQVNPRLRRPLTRTEVLQRKGYDIEERKKR